MFIDRTTVLQHKNDMTWIRILLLVLLVVGISSIGINNIKITYKSTGYPAPPSVLICLKQLETCSNMWFQPNEIFAGADFYDDRFPTI